MNATLKNAVLGTFRKLTRRNLMFLPSVSTDEHALLSLRYQYRVSGDILTVDICEPLIGKLYVDLFTYDQAGGSPLARLENITYPGQGSLKVDLAKGEMTFGENKEAFAVPPAIRKFLLRFSFDSGNKIKTRTTTHYLPGNGRELDEHYYQDANYIDYEARTPEEAEQNLRWVMSYLKRGRALEVGCATGLLLEKLISAGFDAYGLDISEWAVEQAINRVSPERVARADIETDSVPFQAPFDAIILHAVLEHFRDPWAVLRTLDGLEHEGTLLFVHTSNADSLSKMLFGRDWEGYFDYSHYGVDQVTSSRLRLELAERGWELLEFRTWGFWLGNEDESGVCLRQLYAYDSRFRTLLKERELGDFITLVAKRLARPQVVE